MVCLETNNVVFEVNMKQFNTPGVKETRQLINIKIKKSSKQRGRAALESIKNKLENGDLSRNSRA